MAERCGYKSETPVRNAMRRHEIPIRQKTLPRRSVELTRGLLEDLYVTQGLSAREIVDAIGDYSVSTVLLTLKREGIPTRGPRYTRTTPMPELTENLLRQLYLDERLRVHEIAERLGYARNAVSRALGENGIIIEDRRGRPRQNRRDFDPGKLEELYVQAESSDAVGEELGVTGVLLRRRLHDYGIPVRRSRWQHPTDGERRLDRLRRDRRVRAALIQAGIPPWRETGAVPESPLPPGFLSIVYQDLGLSLFDIELLTGRPQNAVRGDLTAAGIAVRPRPGYPRRGGPVQGTE